MSGFSGDLNDDWVVEIVNGASLVVRTLSAYRPETMNLR